jgi:hypothetical protein
MSTEQISNSIEESEPGLEPTEETPIGDEQATAYDEKPRRNLSGLFLIGLLVAVAGSTYFMYKTAGGPLGPTPRAEIAAANATITNFLSGGAQSIQGMVSNLHAAEKMKDQLYSYPTATQIPYDKLKGHPFGLDDAQAGAASNDLSQDDARRAAESTLSKLKLESIVFSGGSQNICMINGRVYSEGQHSSSFVVEKIFAQKVQLKIGAFQFELTVAPPPDSETQE